jgi:hypothetical protein
MKTKHKYILTLSTLVLFVISVFIGYFISTRSISEAKMAANGGAGGGCPDISCTTNDDCYNNICNNMHGVCREGKCDWSTCGTTNQCIDYYCCESEAGQQSNSQCFKEGIYTDNKYLCAPK